MVQFQKPQKFFNPAFLAYTGQAENMPGAPMPPVNLGLMNMTFGSMIMPHFYPPDLYVLRNFWIWNSSYVAVLIFFSRFPGGQYPVHPSVPLVRVPVPGLSHQHSRYVICRERRVNFPTEATEGKVDKTKAVMVEGAQTKALHLPRNPELRAARVTLNLTRAHSRNPRKSTSPLPRKDLFLNAPSHNSPLVALLNLWVDPSTNFRSRCCPKKAVMVISVHKDQPLLELKTAFWTSRLHKEASPTRPNSSSPLPALVLRWTDYLIGNDLICIT